MHSQALDLRRGHAKTLVTGTDVAMHQPLWNSRGSRLIAVGLCASYFALLAPFALASGGGHGGGDHGGGGDSHGAASAPAEEEAVSAESADGTRAVKLGEFNIRVYHSVSSRRDTVTFILQARIDKGSFEVFERLYPHRKIKVRDQVILARGWCRSRTTMTRSSRNSVAASTYGSAERFPSCQLTTCI
jgi:hypothetical protein